MDLQADDAALDAFEELITAALLTSGVLIPVAVKVLHRKRRSLIPMLDNVLLEFYLRLSGVARPGSLTQNKRTAGSAAVTALRLFRHDLVASAAELEYVRTTLGSAGYLLTPVRILEILVWSEVEPRGYYR